MVNQIRKCVVLVFWFVSGIYNSNAMDTGQSEPKTMTFVLGTDQKYITPTSVTIYSLLKNGITNNKRKRTINILLLSDDLNEENKEYIQNSITEMIDDINKTDNGNKYDKSKVCLYFLDTKGDINDLADKFKFIGQNLYEKDIKEEKIKGYMQTRKVALPFYIAQSKGELAYTKSGSMKSITRLTNSGNEKISIFSIYNYMWLDSDTLILGDITALYDECYAKDYDQIKNGQKGVIYTSNLLYTEGDSYKKLNHKLSDEDLKDYSMKVKDISTSEFNITWNCYAPEHNTKTRWRCSGGVMFFNIIAGKQKLFSSEIINPYKRIVAEDEETFYSSYVKNYSELQTHLHLSDDRLENITPGPSLFAFSPKYDYKPNHEEAYEKCEIFDHTILHWDRHIKPWNDCKQCVEGCNTDNKKVMEQCENELGKVLNTLANKKLITYECTANQVWLETCRDMIRIFLSNKNNCLIY